MPERDELVSDPQVPGWSVLDGTTSASGREARLHRELAFADFAEAFAFMTRVALIAQQLDHHPDWSNSWNRVVLDITSHQQGGITGRCVELAERVNQLVD